LDVVDDHLVINVNCVANVHYVVCAHCLSDVKVFYVITSIHHFVSAHCVTFHIFISVMKEFVGVIDFIYLFLTKYDKNKTHTMLTLMLDSKFKNLILIS
jgi:hypothetical protein